MKKSSFLIKLKKEGRLELVEPSEEICDSYLEKSDNCLKSAKILLKNDLYENSVSMSYYTMYNSLTALLFKTGMKCENHAGSILVFGRVFNRPELFKIVSFAKEERIDKEYYVTSKKSSALPKGSARDMVLNAETFLVQVKMIIEDLKNEEIIRLRDKFNKML